jgi:hypothetical protein
MKQHGQAEDLARSAGLTEEDRKRLEADYRAAQDANYSSNEETDRFIPSGDRSVWPRVKGRE